MMSSAATPKANQKFQRDKTAEEAAVYAELVGQKALKQFRKDWTERKLHGARRQQRALGQLAAH